MSFTVFLGNLPAWVTADDIRAWLSAESLVADAIKVIRNPETQESKGFAFIESPNAEEMNSIIRRFDRAPLEDRLLRANPAQPPKPRGQVRPAGPGVSANPTGVVASHVPASHAPVGHNPAGHSSAGHNPAGNSSTGHAPANHGVAAADQRPPRRGKKSGKKSGTGSPSSAFAEELAKAL
jgi:RNA recognition motif-containing protein